jgi:hypothetical protein
MSGLGDLFTREVRVPVAVEHVVDIEGRRVLVFDNGWMLMCPEGDGMPGVGEPLSLGIRAMVYKRADPPDLGDTR